MAVGEVTRGTTNPNRLRRVDRWILHRPCSTIRAAQNPLVVDLGYGVTPVTTGELRDRLVAYVRPDCQVVGIEIEPERVAQAKYLEGPNLSFRHGGFEIPLDGRRPILIRASNVLRQYDEAQVAQAWHTMSQRLAPEGFLVEGTCDEIGRRCTWVAIRAGSQVPESFTISVHVGSLDMPSDIAPRLPKALIHRNVPGEPIHDLLARMDAEWLRVSHMIPFGPRARWVAMIESLRDQGVPVWDSKARWRLGEVTVPWEVVAPTSSPG